MIMGVSLDSDEHIYVHVQYGGITAFSRILQTLPKLWWGYTVLLLGILAQHSESQQ